MPSARPDVWQDEVAINNVRSDEERRACDDLQHLPKSKMKANEIDIVNLGRGAEVM